jgi:hypothetical protein
MPWLVELYVAVSSVHTFGVAVALDRTWSTTAAALLLRGIENAQ